MIDHLPRRVHTSDDVRATIDAMCRMSANDGHEFLASIAALARQAGSKAELERLLTSIYAVALEHGHPFLPDLTDGVLQWLEHASDGDVADALGGAVPTNA